MRLTGARGGLVHSARPLAAAALLALCGALALPATAEAQTATTLVSNVDQVHADDSVANNWTRELSQTFTTGMNEDGYTLTGVDIVSASSTGFTAKVCGTDADGIYPTSTCTDLTPPDSFAEGTMSFTTTLSLVKSRTYAVVVEAAETHPDHGRVQGWEITGSDDVDMGHDDEWSIGNGFRSRWGSGDEDWDPEQDEALRIAIKGTTVGAGPTLSVADAEADEGEGMDFTVTLSEAVTDAVTATWTASIETGDTAVAADLGSPTTGTLTIAISETATTITVPTAEDFTDEEDETFTVTLSGVSASAQLATDPTATGTIVDDDAPPIVVTPSADALVSNVGQDQSTTLDGGSVVHERQVGQAFTTGTNEDGYTFAGVDIVSASSTGFTAQLCPTDSSGYPTSTCTDLTPPDSFAVGAMSFTPPADSTLTKGTTYAVVLTVDTLVGGFYTTGWSATDSTDEDTVSAAGWSIADGHLLRTSASEAADWSSTRGVQPLRIAIRGTAVGAGPTLSVADAEADEGEAMTFSVTLSEAATDAVTATWTASIESGDTAVAAELGSTTTGPVSIAAGATMTTFTVTTAEDSTDEDDETFTVTLSGVSASAQLAADPTATGTIVDDDAAPIVVTPSADALVSNVGQTGEPLSVTTNTKMSQKFTTGSNASGYILTGVDIVSASTTAFTAQVCETDDATEHPTSTCWPLTVDGGFREGTVSFTAPADTTLTTDTIYAVVVVDPSGSHGYGGTDSNNEDAGHADGWSIGNSSDFNDPAEDLWEAEGGGRSLRIAIKGNAVDGTTPSTGATLSDLVVNDGNMDLTLTPGFASDEYTYTVSAGSTVAEVTVTAMTTDSGASIEYLKESDDPLTDANTSDSGHQVAVVEGDNVFKVKVTAADGNTTQTYTVTVNRAAAPPPITEVAVTSIPKLTSSGGGAADTYGAGETIEVSVTFDEPVTATADTDFVLSVGGDKRAPLLRGSGTATLVFGYTVQAADTDDDGIWIANQDRTLVGDRNANAQTGTIASVATGEAANLTHSALGVLSGHKVDGTRSIVGIAVSSTPLLTSDTYGAGERIRLRVTFNVAVDVTGDPVLTFALGNSGDTREVDAAYESRTGRELVFGYTVVSDDEDGNGIFLSGGSNLSGRDSPLELDSDDSITFTGTSTDVPLAWPTGSGTQSGHKVDGSRSIRSVAVTSKPLLTSSGASTRDTYGADETIEISVTFTEAVDATTDTDFVLSVGGAKSAPLLRGSGTETLVFGYTVLAADEDTDGIWIGDQSRTLVGNRNGDPQTGTITSVATGVAAGLTHSQLGTQSDHKVDGSQAATISTVTIEADQPAFTSRLDNVTFTLTRTETAAARDVAVVLTQDQPLLPDSEDLAHTVAFGAGEATATLRIRTLLFNPAVTQEGTLTATVQSGAGYAPGSPNTASTRIVVTDPAVTAWIEKTAYTFAEDDADASVAIILRTATGVPLPNRDMYIAFSIKQNPGQALPDEDFGRLAEAVQFQPSDFTADGTEFTARREVPLSIVDDTVEEPNETLAVVIERGPGLPEAAALRQPDGTACPPEGCEVTVTIVDNDGAASTDATLRALVVNDGNSDLTLTPTFASDEDTYTAMVLSTVTEVTVKPMPNDAGATIEYLDGSDATLTDLGTADGHQVAVAAGDTVIKVKVTAEDGVATQTYTVTVNRATADATLSDLTVTAGGSDLVTFASGTTDYAASVANTVAEVTVTAMTTDSGATIEYLDGDDATLTDADTSDPGHQVAVVEGDNVIKVKVTAADGNATQTYVVTVNRAAAATAPTIVSVAVTSTPTLESDTYGEGETIEVSVTFDQAVTATANTDFVLSVAGTKRAPLLDGSGTATLVFGYTVLADDEDTDGIWIGDQDQTLVGNRSGDPQNGEITSVDTGVAADLTHDELGVQSGHKVDGSPSAVEPVEPPAVTLHLSDADGEVAEDAGAVTVTARVSPALATAFTVTVSASPVAPATDDDFELSANRALSFAANATASAGTVTIAPVDDGDAESNQVVTVSGSASIDDVTGPGDVTLTILDNDLVNISGICNRTPRVRDRILVLLENRHSFKGGCGDVNETHLAQLESLDLGRNPSTESAFTMSLRSNDFEGLVNLERLYLRETGLDSLPAGVFSGLAALDTLELDKNRLRSLPDGVFSDLLNLKTLELHRNQLSSLPYDEFEALPNLTKLLVDPEGRRGYQVAGGVDDATLEVAAGGTTTYRVRLTHTPAYVGTANLPTLTASSDTAGVTATPATLRFTKENWFRRQTVTVDAPASAAGATATLSHTSTGVTLDRPIPTVTVRVLESGNSRSADPLTADFQGLPSSHDGETAFSFRIAFSEAVAVTPEAMRTHVLDVAGGAVTGAARVDGESGAWEITVAPDSRDELSITLAPAADCEADGAVCTSDGRALSNGASHIVIGPADEPERNTAATGTPTISGTPQVGEALTASTSGISDADGLDNASFAHQWIRTDTDIGGATGATYTAVAADEGERLKVRVGFTDDAGNGESLVSAATDAVAAAPPTNTAATGAPTIGGTPQVGEALTASTSGISDADGLDDASFGYQWIRTDTDIGGATGSTYTPVATDEGAGLKVRVDFSDDAGNAESLVSAATAAVEAAPDPLTAAFESMPEAHDGESAFRFRVAFSDAIKISYKTLRDASFAVTGGEVTRASRVDGRRDLWKITVEPDSHEAVRIDLPETTGCGAAGAICTDDGRPLSHALSAAVAGPAGLSVADAEADEAPGATMRFAVTLDRAAAGAATVDWATADGTARAGDDYAAAEGTLKFAPGERSKTVAVTLLDDSVDDAGETFRVLLSNASGARLADAEGIGTIRNADPLPRAWLARFGRTAADHAVDAIAERFDSPGGGDPHATFAGRRLWNGGGRAGADDDAFAPGWLFGPVPGDPFGAPGAGLGGSPRLDPGSGVGGSGRSFGTGAGVNAGMNGGPGGSAGHGGTGAGAMRGPPAAGGYRPTLRDLLIRSSFRLSVGDDGGSRRLTGWGRAAATRFDGVSDGVPVDGDVATFLVGADAAWNRWLAGISVAHSLGGGAFRGGAGGTAGELDGTLTAVHPYVRYQATGRLSAWGVLGYGAGDLTLATDGSTWRTDTSMRMAAGGARGVFLRGGGGLELAAKMDARLTRIASDAATGEAGLLGATAGDTSRVRLLLEGSRTFAFGAGRRLTPTLELGVRRDGGDAETGAGVDLGGSLRYADAALGLTVDAGGRYLAAHEDDAYREWGASASIRLDPGTPGRGLTLSVMPSWGAAATGGAERLWSAHDARGLAGHGFDAALRLRADIGYGLPAFRGRGAAMPFAGMSTMGRGDRDWRAGARWTRGAALRMSLEATRRETAGAPPSHGIAFRVAWRPGARGPARGAAGAAGAGDGLRLGAQCPGEATRRGEAGEAAAVATGAGPPPDALACSRAPGP